jgi:hypothetical protein
MLLVRRAWSRWSASSPSVLQLSGLPEFSPNGNRFNLQSQETSARREDLIGILSLENGKVRAEAAFELDMIPRKFRYWASAVLTTTGVRLRSSPGISRS